MVIPKSCIKKNVPTKEIGTAITGIKVERQSPKKINTTNATNINASTNVCITFSIDASKNLDTSYPKE